MKEFMPMFKILGLQTIVSEASLYHRHQTDRCPWLDKESRCPAICRQTLLASHRQDSGQRKNQGNTQKNNGQNSFKLRETSHLMIQFKGVEKCDSECSFEVTTVAISSSALPDTFPDAIYCPPIHLINLCTLPGVKKRSFTECKAQNVNSWPQSSRLLETAQ
ncbi:E3 Ubiquitin-Protein Ligase Rlim [Manis pentadactyla]|nr:E3 Ubiquitin-Protein Ligase Rlim [Manis pentadactyla]